MTKAPIFITVYNRITHFKKCIEHLKRCEFASESVLYISSDALYIQSHKNDIDEIRSFILSIEGFKKVVPVFQDVNRGLDYCFNFVKELICKEYDSFIFLEDDVVVGPDFLRFMNSGLFFYEADPSVVSISGFSHSVFFENEIEGKEGQVYFTNRWCPWGFATWNTKFEKISRLDLATFRKNMQDEKFKNRLNQIGIDLLPVYTNMHLNNRLPVLDLRYCFNMVAMNYVCCTPYSTITFNIGNDGEGTRTIKNSRFTGYDLTNLNRNISVDFRRYSLELVDNSFNFRLNLTIKNKFKNYLIKLGMINIAYIIYKKWLKRR